MDKPASCMQANKTCHLQIATGGKENDLKIWNGSKPEKPVFQAKNVTELCLVTLYYFGFLRLGKK